MAKDKQAEPPEELEELARRYVDLWQDQMTALAADPEFAESLQKVMAAMGVAASGLPAMWSAWPAAMSTLMSAAQPGTQMGMTNPQGQETDDKPTGGKQNGSGQAAGPGGAEAGAEAAAAAPHGGGADLGVLEERLAALEQRIRSLEGGSGRARGGAKAKSKRD
ncbi:hypothetical protein [Pelagibius marinus]|uniref:hypothetical protein n=1 Tax=Pelagibius marinus TaxID=2762760 RepID=UPI001D045164|nr:hypothetical protein [Pelagibius marinus]